MPDTITVCEDSQIIQVNSWGEVAAEDLQKSLDTVLEIHRDQGLSKVLVDATRQTSLPSTMSLFDFGSELAGSLTGVRLAVAVSPHTRQDVTFLEAVSRNRGACMTIYDSVDAARASLTESATSAIQTPQDNHPNR